MDNSIIKEILKFGVWCLLLSLFYKLTLVLNITSQQLYAVGIAVGVLLCLMLNSLSMLATNICIIVKLFSVSAEDFGKFLNSLGYSIEVSKSDNLEDNNEEE